MAAAAAGDHAVQPRAANGGMSHAFNVRGGGQPVERGMKHFQWLHDRLAAKYTCLCVPPLPSSDDSSKKYGEDKAVKRQERLTKEKVA